MGVMIGLNHTDDSLVNTILFKAPNLLRLCWYLVKLVDGVLTIEVKASSLLAGIAAFSAPLINKGEMDFNFLIVTTENHVRKMLIMEPF